MSGHPRFEEALALHRRVPVVDGHADSILQVVAGKRTLFERSQIGHLDFPRAREGGLAATVQTAWPAPAHYPVAASRVFAMIDALLGQVEAAAPAVRLVRTLSEVKVCTRATPLAKWKTDALSRSFNRSTKARAAAFAFSTSVVDRLPLASSTRATVTGLSVTSP